MKRYTIIDKDPLSVSIDGYVRLEDPDTGANVATVFVDCQEPKHEDDFETPITEESARRLRSLQVNPEMEELLQEYHNADDGPLAGYSMRCGCGTCIKKRRLFNYIETGEEI